MGKAVPRGIKSKAIALFESFPESCTLNFEKNKEFVNSLNLELSPVNRNLIAGYIGRLVEAKIKEDQKGKMAAIPKMVAAAKA